MTLREFVWTLRSWVLDVFKHFIHIDATDISKIGSNQDRIKFNFSLYPLSISLTLPLVLSWFFWFSWFSWFSLFSCFFGSSGFPGFPGSPGSPGSLGSPGFFGSSGFPCS